MKLGDTAWVVIDCTLGHIYDFFPSEKAAREMATHLHVENVHGTMYGTARVRVVEVEGE